MTIPLVTLLGLADRPGEMTARAAGPVLTRDLAAAAARNTRSTWCLTVTDQDGHAIGHGCARPAPKSHTKRAAAAGPPGFRFTPAARPARPAATAPGCLRHPRQRDLIIALDSITADPCDHRHQAKGHDPGVKLRHLAQVRHATCTGPGCRRPADQCDFEHNTPYEAGGRTCLCNGNPTAGTTTG